MISIPGSNSEFIELDRTFHVLPERLSELQEYDFSLSLGLGKPLRWSNLVPEYRLVILSEAGSGKTYEIRNIARTLRKQGKPAFFLRLEHIAQDFEIAFEVGTFEAFEEWLRSDEEAWLLLDSVDEARLRDPGDFELAIRKLSKRIRSAYNRAHIVITGRTTAWRPKTDLNHCIAHFPCAPESESTIDVRDEDEKLITRKPNKPETKNERTFKVVALDDLTSDQIAVFAKAKGIKNSKAFLDALERADAWSFASRPQDLRELTEFWLDKGKVGTRRELMQNSIDRRLTERDQGRADARPLSVERAYEGAKLLAALTTLAREQTITVPDGAENSKGLPVQSVLPDWDDTEQSTLLSRPIFDEAIYGTVRFHHRSVREYLTAEWFADLLERSTSRRAMEGQFFRKQYGVDIIVPTLRPILSWLAIRDEKIRTHILDVAPEILFEGGDPSRLPLEIRRRVLHEVCEKETDEVTDRSIHDRSAVQRFARSDLSDDVRLLLRKYADNDDLTAFLLRMVWLGRLSEALPEAMKVALEPKAEKYTRITAFRAVTAIGSDEDQERVRQNFLAEAPELKREWIGELIDGIQPTERIIQWLLACLEKSELPEDRFVDRTSINLTRFVGAINPTLLPKLVTGLNALLSRPPTIEHYYCEISERFQWLMAPASKAVEGLILARHPASLEPDALAILCYFPAFRYFGASSLNHVKSEFSKLIPEWKQLNRVLFWFAVQRSRERIHRQRGERLTSYRQAATFDSFWKFDENDLDYAVGEVSKQNLIDDKMVALSLAFDLYKMAGRPRSRRERMKKVVVGNDELSSLLNTYLRPTAQSPEERHWKRESAKTRRYLETEEKKKEKNRADWKRFLTENLGNLGLELRDNPGSLTNPICYLFEQTQDEQHTSRGLGEYNWQTLIPTHGEEVSRFYRDSVVFFWRHHKPKVRSEGAPSDKIPYKIIIGLTGIEIEARETDGWAKTLSTEDVEFACRYASHELNGFPPWFSELFEVYPQIVSRFLMQEIRYELSIEDPETDTHYVIYDLSWSGHWAWNELGKDIYDTLSQEPKNLSNLDQLLKILLGSDVSSSLVEKLASQKCNTLREPEHMGRWFAVWADVAPNVAIAGLRTRLEEMVNPKEQTQLAMIFVSHLGISREISHNVFVVRQAFKKPAYLKVLYLLMHKYIRHDEDISHVEVYTPGLRDHAQNAREALLAILSQTPGKESFTALNEIAEAHPVKAYRAWIKAKAQTRAVEDGDIESWTPSAMREFHEKMERTPRNHRELANLAVMRFLDLKDDLEHGDSSIARILQNVTQETDMRNYIGKELREKAFGRYSVVQEEELADAKRPDLRFHGSNIDAPVPVELKIADNKWWTGPKLFERLENQLCGDYMRDNRSARGIFVLVYRGEKNSWETPKNSASVDFEGLTAALQAHWQSISSEFPKIDDIAVIGIDLTKRSR